MKKGIVLSVDDDEGLQIVLKQYLETDGYSVVTANSGEQLAEKLKSISPNIILLDLVLPGADGTSLISFIRSQSQVPIIVVSGKHDTTEKIICLEVGADDYLTKPFEMRELSARIKAALRRQDNQEQSGIVGSSLNDDIKSKITFGSFVLDLGQFQVFDNKDNSLDLTTGEFKLVEALVNAPNRALSREHLFELTRDGDYDTFDRAIDIQVGKIRKKLGIENKNLFRTVRGVGYMYCPPNN